MSEDLIGIGIGVLTASLGMLSGYVLTRWEDLKKKANETETTIDNQVIALAENFAQSLLRAKAEDPQTPLGTPPKSE